MCAIKALNNLSDRKIYQRYNVGRIQIFVLLSFALYLFLPLWIIIRWSSYFEFLFNFNVTLVYQYSKPQETHTWPMPILLLTFWHIFAKDDHFVLNLLQLNPSLLEIVFISSWSTSRVHHLHITCIYPMSKWISLTSRTFSHWIFWKISFECLNYVS